MTLEFQLTATNSKRPKRVEAGTDCFDLYLSSATALGGGVTQYNCGVSVTVPVGFVALLLPHPSIKYTGQVFCSSPEVLFPGDSYVQVTTARVSDVYDYFQVGAPVARLLLVPQGAK